MKLSQYYSGLNQDGRNIDFAQSVYWLEQAAHSNHIQAQYDLALYYDVGSRGITPDYVAAFKWYEKAALEGHIEAQDDLSQCYELGKGTTRDKEKAKEWKKEANEVRRHH